MPPRGARPEPSCPRGVGALRRSRRLSARRDALVVAAVRPPRQPAVAVDGPLLAGGELAALPHPERRGDGGRAQELGRRGRRADDRDIVDPDAGQLRRHPRSQHPLDRVLHVRPHPSVVRVRRRARRATARWKGERERDKRRYRRSHLPTNPVVKYVRAVRPSACVSRRPSFKRGGGVNAKGVAGAVGGRVYGARSALGRARGRSSERVGREPQQDTGGPMTDRPIMKLLEGGGDEYDGESLLGEIHDLIGERLPLLPETDRCRRRLHRLYVGLGEALDRAPVVLAPRSQERV